MKNLTSAQRGLALLPILLVIFGWAGWNIFFSKSDPDLESLTFRSTPSNNTSSNWEYGKVATALQSNPFEPIGAQKTSLTKDKLSSQLNDDLPPSSLP